MKNQSPESPFLSTSSQRPKIELIVLQLLMVVSAGIALLFAYAAQVPALTSELNAWLGRPSAVYDRGEGRRSHVIFALMCYTAPLALGLLVSVLHVGINWLNQRWQRQQADDDEFRIG